MVQAYCPLPVGGSVPEPRRFFFDVVPKDHIEGGTEPQQQFRAGSELGTVSNPRQMALVAKITKLTHRSKKILDGTFEFLCWYVYFW